MNPRVTSASAGDRAVRVRLDDGPELQLHAFWLRDACACARCRHPKTRQRLVEIADIPPDVRPLSVAVDAAGALAVTWSPDAHGPHESVYPAAWLRAHTSAAPVSPPRTGWDATLARRMPDLDHATLDTPAGRLAFLDAFAALGLVRLRGVPHERGEVARTAERFGHVRATNYGRIFDVASVPDATHLAYTDVALALHTDNPYRDPVPGVQLLHCLESSARGGDSVMVDGVTLAERLRAEAPDALEVLRTTPVPFRYRDATCDLRREHPMLRLDAAGTLVAIHFNDRSMEPLRLAPERLDAFYAAFRRLDALTRDPALRLVFRLEPGDLVVFDNERILHGREAFDGQTGRRLLQGCYADRDAFDSAWRMAHDES
ncbi:MAG: TauD/TfdA family dioxygenase [Deltaproteobacteria bacterium]|nr:TauD/TfdA family dioxygenase [Deltaproteobacteria bacterium]MCB9788013.1 TauD/TfdA family dioxygenase [Deltaproteobacteria bacterium]